MFVKVCGLRTPEDVKTAVAAGADAVGFVFAESVRRVETGVARELVADVPPEILTVGVFKGVSAAEAAEVALDAGVGAIQLHGDYPASAFAELRGLPFRLIRATTLRADTDVAVGAYGEDMLLLDSPVADRDVLEVRPRSDRNRPQTGVFSTRSPDRPNPIGLHRVQITSIDGTRVGVRELEAIDGTPIVDVKPVLDKDTER